MSGKLTLADIVDLRAYERERDAFRARIIELKKLRRVAVGPIITLLFENRETIRFQIQEMARAERMLTDQAIQAELDTYNPLIPEAGRLSATLFIELTSKDQLMEWLPKLVGIEQAIWLEIGSGVAEVQCDVDPAHASQLTREEITASVHYVSFTLQPSQVEAFAKGPVSVVVRHPNYSEGVVLSRETIDSLSIDLKGA